MYRRNTVEALLRQHMREKEQLLAIIREQNDRIMLLAGRQYAPTPLELSNDPEPEPDPEERRIEVGQWADDLGGDVY